MRRGSEICGARARFRELKKDAASLSLSLSHVIIMINRVIFARNRAQHISQAPDILYLTVIEYNNLSHHCDKMERNVARTAFCFETKKRVICGKIIRCVYMKIKKKRA